MTREEILRKINILASSNPALDGDPDFQKFRRIAAGKAIDSEALSMTWKRVRGKFPVPPNFDITIINAASLPPSPVAQSGNEVEEQAKKGGWGGGYSSPSAPLNESLEQRLEQAAKNQVVSEMTTGNEEYLREHERYQALVMEEWHREKKGRSIGSDEAKEFQKSERYRTLVNSRFIDAHEKEFYEKYEKEKNKAYSIADNDPTVKELRKMLKEAADTPEEKAAREKAFKGKQPKDQKPQPTTAPDWYMRGHTEEIAITNDRQKRILHAYARRFENKLHGGYLDELGEFKHIKVPPPKNRQKPQNLKDYLKSWLLAGTNLTTAPKVEKRYIPQSIPSHSEASVGEPSFPSSPPPNSASRPPTRGRPHLPKKPSWIPKIPGLGGPGGFIPTTPGGLLKTFANPFNYKKYILIILLMLLFVMFFSTAAIFDQDELTGIEITKTSDKTEVPNPNSSAPQASDITFTINASAEASNLTITDPIPDNAMFVSATGNYSVIKDSAGNVTSVSWDFQSSSSSGSGTISTPTDSYSPDFDEQKFKQFGFPSPTTPTEMNEGQKIRWKTYLLPHAVKAASLLNIDIGWIGMWAWIEDGFNTYMDNCNDKEYNPNTYCSGWNGNWQVGYGNHPAYMKGYLKAAMKAMRPGESPQQIGQRVIDESKIQAKYSGKFTPITNPSTFPNVTIDQILSGADKGNQEMRMLLGLLMKDDAIGAYLIGQHFLDLTRQHRERLASVMEGWTKDYYNRQKVVNLIAGIYQAGIDNTFTDSPDTIGGDVQLVVRPKPDAKDTYIINYAYAEGEGIDPDATGSATTGNNPAPNNNTCQNRYYLAKSGGINFGDPNCELINDPKVAFTPGSRTFNIQGKLLSLLKARDAQDLAVWVALGSCETTGYNPNAVNINSTNGSGAYGLYQMAKEGKNYKKDGSDRGDVYWTKQVENATTHANWSESVGLYKYAYWNTACFRSRAKQYEN